MCGFKLSTPVGTIIWQGDEHGDTVPAISEHAMRTIHALRRTTRIEAWRGRVGPRCRDRPPGRAVDRIERGRAQIEVKLAKGARHRARRHVKAAELIAQRDELEAACGAFTQQITSVYAPNSKVIAATMATSWRLQAIIQRAERRGSRVPRLSFPLSSSDFCASLKLLDIGPKGLNGFLWYAASPDGIDKIKAEDAVDLSRISADFFVSGGEEGEAAAKAAS